jgi:hypothetical protein
MPLWVLLLLFSLVLIVYTIMPSDQAARQGKQEAVAEGPMEPTGR